MLFCEFFTAQRARLVLIQHSGLIYAWLAENMATVFEHCGSVEDIKTDRALIILGFVLTV